MCYMEYTGIKKKIDRAIEKYSKGVETCPEYLKVDLSILRLAIYEIVFRDDIPLNVSINEAVELAKNYSEGKKVVHL